MVDFRINIIVDPGPAVNGAGQAERAIGKVQNRADGLRRELARLFAAFGGFLAVRTAIRTMAEFEQSIATIGAVTNATEDEMKLFSQTAQELGRTTRFTASQAADSLVLLARAGFTVQESVSAVRGTLRLAQAAAIDLSTATDITANTLRGFRLAAEESIRVVDVLGLTANRANTNVQELGEGMKFVAPVSAGLNVSLETTAAAMGVLSDAGLKASIAGTGLRRVLTALEAPNQQQVKILKSLGISTDEVRVSQVGLVAALERLRDAGLDTGKAINFFGQRGGPAFEVLSSNIPRVRQLTKALEESAGTSERMAKTMDDTLKGAFFRLKSAAEGYILTLDESTNASKNLSAALDFLSDKVNILSESFGSGIRAAEADKALVQFGERVNTTRQEISRLQQQIAGQGFASEGQAAQLQFLQDRLAKLTGTYREQIVTAQKAEEAEKQAAIARELAADSTGDLVDGERTRSQVLQDTIRELDNEFEKTQALIAGQESLAQAIDIVNQLRQDGVDDLSTGELQVLHFLLERNKSLKDQQSALESIVGPQREINREIAAQIELQKQHPELVSEISRRIDELRLRGLESSTALGDGFSRAFLRMKLEAEDLASVAEKVVNTFADHAVDAIVKFAETGEFKFREFASAILSDLTRILARLLVVQALSAAFGGGGVVPPVGGQAGGSFGGFRAEGGPVQPGRSYIVGEGGRPEMFTPNQPGFITPAVPQQQAPVIQVTNVSDPDEIPSAIGSGSADHQILNVLSRNKQKVNRILGSS